MRGAIHRHLGDGQPWVDARVFEQSRASHARPLRVGECFAKLPKGWAAGDVNNEVTDADRDRHRRGDHAGCRQHAQPSVEGQMLKGGITMVRRNRRRCGQWFRRSLRTVGPSTELGPSKLSPVVPTSWTRSTTPSPRSEEGRSALRPPSVSSPERRSQIGTMSADDHPRTLPWSGRPAPEVRSRPMSECTAARESRPEATGAVSQTLKAA